ncbi:MAG: diguanylate cyclase [Anaerolineaceae bacterium]|nr:diguanylate cyclase [Anaerolineaceae bacterium]
MFFNFTPYALLLFLTTFVAVVLLGITLKKREEPGGFALLGVLFSLIVWSFFAGLSAGSSSIANKIITTKLAYFGIVSLPVNLLLFSIYYTSNRKLLNPIRIFFLWFIPFVGLFLILTNEQHNMIWIGYTYRTSIFGSALVYERGLGFWGLIIYFYSCVIFTLFIIIWTAFRFQYIYRKNMTVLMIMVPFSLLINILYVFELFPGWRGFDPTPFSLIIFTSLMVWSFTKHKFFDLSPVGREVVIDQMRSLLMILDTKYRIVDFNHPMQAIISKIAGKSTLENRKIFIGHSVQSILADWPEFIKHLFDEKPDLNEVELCLEDQRYVFEIQKKPLENRDARPLGWLVFLFDITDRIQLIEAEIRNRQLAQSLHEIAMVVNSTLDPQKTLNLALEQIGKIIPYDIANISILHGEERVIEFQRGYKDPDSIIGLRVPLGNSPHQQALIHRHPVMYSDLQNDFSSYHAQMVKKANSMLCIPMYAKDDILGFLTLGSEKKDYFTNEDISIADAYASQVAVSLQNSRLFTQVNRRLNEQSIMNEIIRIGSSRMEKKDFARAITDQIHRFIKTPGILVIENDPEEGSWYFVDLYDVEEYKIDRVYSYQDGLTGYLLQQGKPLLLNNSAEVEEILNKYQRTNIGAMPKTFMGAPMITKNRVIGAIVAHDLEKENAFDEEDFKLFLMITSQAAIGFENVRLISQLEYLASTDALTGIYNRGYFHNVSKKILNSVEQDKTHVSMIMMDVDLFKGLNDTHGHQMGDLVLQKTVEVCKSLLRDKDVIGRVGGEEFSIVLPETTLEEAKKIAERIRQAIENLKIHNNGSAVQTTLSLGVASSTQVDNGTLEDLIQISDQALYRAKADGRNCVRVYNN